MRKIFFIAATLFLSSALLLAQGPGQRPMNRERIRENINRLRLLRMTEVLDLNEEQTAKIYPSATRIEKEKMDILREMNKAIANLKDQLKESSPKEEALAPQVRRIKELKQSLQQKDREFEDMVESHLTEIQKARYLIFSTEFYRGIMQRAERARGLAKEKREF